MLKQAKTNASRFLAVFLTLLLIWGMIPVGVVPAFAAENNTVTVQLPDGVSAQITLTDEQDAKKVYTAQTDESFAATLEGVDDAATYTLMVSQMEQYKDYTLANVTVGTNQPIKIAADVLQEKDTRTFAFAETGLTKMFGDSSFFLTFTEETTLEGITVSYTSSEEKVATVSAQGEVTILGAGNTTITATAQADGEYKEAKATLPLTVKPSDKVISFATNEVTDWVYGDTNKSNALAVQPDASGTVTFSSDTDVVTVDETTGAVTVNKPGKAEITAHFNPNEGSNYAAQSASYTVMAGKKPLKIDIVLKISFGQDDPDLQDDAVIKTIRDQAKEQIEKQLAACDKGNAEVLDRLVKLIKQNGYDSVPVADEYRAENCSIIFEEAIDDNYDFSGLKGTLKVDGAFGLNPDAKYYAVAGWTEVSENKYWVKQGDTITVKALGNYKINAKDKRTGWSDALTFTEKAEGTFNRTFFVRDAEGKISQKCKISFQVDGTAPAISRFDFAVKGNKLLDKIFNFLTFGTFCNEEVTVRVKKVKDDASGADKATLYYNDEVYGQPTEIIDGEASFTLSVDDFKTMKTISATATDKVGNVSDMVYVNSGNSNFRQAGNGMLQLETNGPKVKFDIPDATSTDADRNEWYGDDIAIKVTVSDAGEENSGIRSVYAMINGETVAISDSDFTNALATSIESSKENYYFIDKKTEQLSLTVNTNQTEKKPNDGAYTVTIVACDNAGNEQTYSNTVYIDRDAPEIKEFKFTPSEKKDPTDTGAPAVTKESYGFFFQEETTVTVVVDDAQPSAGLKEIVYYTVEKGSENKQHKELNAPIENGEATFNIGVGFKGQIYARAVDNVGHTPKNEDATDKYVNPNGAAIEDSERHKEHSAVTARVLSSTTYKDAAGLPLYTWGHQENAPDGIPVELYVKDTFSGIQSVTWTVSDPADEVQSQNAQVDLKNDYEVGAKIDGWTITAMDCNLVTEMSRVIYVTNNSNAISVNVKLTDRAGNTSENSLPGNSLTFSVDNTAPIVTVTYDDDKSPADNGFPTFYKAPRTATITVTERNFDPNAVQFDIKSVHSDKNIPDTSSLEWTAHRVNETYRTDEDTYTATITFEADDDYTLAVASCKDLAERVCTSFTYEGKSEPTLFTIDKTAPTVTVSYDNNASMNGNYFKANRIATITVTEHNFDAGRVTVNGNATDNGASAAFPGLVWTSDNGDIHTATIHYAADAHYTFSIDITDKAGNTISNQAQAEFYVDKTAPTLEITGVADRSANNGTVAPIINFMDTNFDADAVTYTLAGVNNGTVTYPASKADVANGQTVTFADFERVQNVDDIYTLTATITDKAGNETTKTITFSANRFGSVYDLDGLKNMLGKYLRNEEDVVFTEVNVDSLNKSETKLKITKNGTPRDLVEGVDYTVLETGGSGLWSRYRYTINKALFTDDGRYSISVYTVDAAGNINENIDETKKAEISFGVDKTNPVIVPIDFESGVQYPVEVKTVSLEIKDNLVLDSVKIYLNDVEVQYENSGETYTFDIPEKNEKQNVRIVAVDAAGNAYELPVENFLVSTNVFVRWFNNTPLFVGSLVGVALIAGAIVFLVGSKRTKKEAAAK